VDQPPQLRLAAAGSAATAWPVLTPVIDAQMQTTDPDDLRRLAELLAHINARPLLKKLLARARDIDDPEAREVADDFTDQYGPLRSPPPEPGSNL
jgi:hypothetical protein